MTTSAHIVMACTVMVLLVAAVGLRLFTVRMAEIKSNRIRLQEVATSRQTSARFEAVQVSDNFKNLFEVPVLFYLLCALLLITGNTSTTFAAGIWLFVLLRVAHSTIQCTYNNVVHRFLMFAVSSLLLLLMWLVLALSVANLGR